MVKGTDFKPDVHVHRDSLDRAYTMTATTVTATSYTMMATAKINVKN